MDVLITDYHSLWQYGFFIFLEIQLYQYIGFVRVRELGEVASQIIYISRRLLFVYRREISNYFVFDCKYKVTLRLSIFLQSKMPSHPLALEMEKYWIRPCRLQAH